ncbi:TIGR04086 family membrane protein [Natronospora cellulosivora (SeqCode)]
MFNQNNSEKNINNLVIFKGVFWGLIILLLITVLMSIFSTFIFSINTATLNIILLLEVVIILTIIGIYVARRVDRNGWLNGGLAGIIYMIILILLGTITMPISLGRIIFLVLIGLFIGSIGGIIGKNI